MPKAKSYQLNGRSKIRGAAKRTSAFLLRCVPVLLLAGGLLRMTLDGQVSQKPARADTSYPAVETTTPSAYFAETGYWIVNPAFLAYFEQHGGVGAFGFPVSKEFFLLGRNTQLFQRHALQLGRDGSVQTMNLPDAVLPVTHLNGSVLPASDPELVAAIPDARTPDYSSQAAVLIGQYVRDEWNGLPVNFRQAFLSAVACDRTAPDSACDDSMRFAHGLDVWGLPTSQPAIDPNNPGFVYQRFQRGIMHFAHTTGTTQGVLLGDWFKRVLIGAELPPDFAAEVRSSPFYSQYSRRAPLGLARPLELTETSLDNAFGPDVTDSSPTATADARQAAPRIVRFIPPSDSTGRSGAGCGDPLIVQGSNFGASQDEHGGILFFDGRVVVRSSIVTWTDTAIMFYVRPVAHDVQPFDTSAEVLVQTEQGNAFSRYTPRNGTCTTATRSTNGVLASPAIDVTASSARLAGRSVASITPTATAVVQETTARSLQVSNLARPPTATSTPTAYVFHTSTPMPSASHTPTPTPVRTPTRTPTATATSTSTPTPTRQPTAGPGATPTTTPV